MALILLVAASTRWCRGYTLELAKEALFPSLFIFWGELVQFLLFLWFFFFLAWFTTTLETDRIAEGGERPQFEPVYSSLYPLHSGT